MGSACSKDAASHAATHAEGTPFAPAPRSAIKLPPSAPGAELQQFAGLDTPQTVSSLAGTIMFTGLDSPSASGYSNSVYSAIQGGSIVTTTTRQPPVVINLNRGKSLTAPSQTVAPAPPSPEIDDEFKDAKLLREPTLNESFVREGNIRGLRLKSIRGAALYAGNIPVVSDESKGGPSGWMSSRGVGQTDGSRHTARAGGTGVSGRFGAVGVSGRFGGDGFRNRVGLSARFGLEGGARSRSAPSERRLMATVSVFTDGGSDSGSEGPPEAGGVVDFLNEGDESDGTLASPPGSARDRSTYSRGHPPPLLETTTAVHPAEAMEPGSARRSSVAAVTHMLSGMAAALGNVLRLGSGTPRSARSSHPTLGDNGAPTSGRASAPVAPNHGGGIPPLRSHSPARAAVPSPAAAALAVQARVPSSSATEEDATSSSNDASGSGGGGAPPPPPSRKERPGRPHPSPPSTLSISITAKHVHAFESENFMEVGKEWEHLKTLRLVFERAGLDSASQDRFLKALTPASFQPGQYIVRQGDAGDAFYIITEGEVAVTRDVSSAEEAVAAAAGGAHLRADNREMVLTHLYAGAFFGETSLVNDAPRNANVVVSSKCPACVMVMSKACFTPFMQQDPSFRKMIAELVLKKDETQRRRREALAAARGGGNTPAAEGERNEVKISTLQKKGRTRGGKAVVNGYVLTQKLGRGSYGTVWLALSVAGGHKFAMKIVSRSLLRKKRIGTSSTVDDDVLREVAVTKRMSHANVVKLYELIDDAEGDEFIMVQEFMELGCVMVEQEFNAALQPDVARRYFRDILKGVQYMHFQGAVHRDIKPSNVLIGGNGVAKIADFGAVAILPGGVDALSDVKGTPAFQPPEVFTLNKGDTYSGFAVDVWALGATLHAMVVGVPPFMAANHLALVDKVKNEEFRMSNAVNIDPHLRNLLTRALEKDPAKRITLKEMMAHEWVTEEGVRPMPWREYANLGLAATAVTMSSSPSRPYHVGRRASADVAVLGSNYASSPGVTTLAADRKAAGESATAATTPAAAAGFGSTAQSPQQHSSVLRHRSELVMPSSRRIGELESECIKSPIGQGARHGKIGPAARDVAPVSIGCAPLLVEKREQQSGSESTGYQEKQAQAAAAATDTDSSASPLATTPVSMSDNDRDAPPGPPESAAMGAVPQLQHATVAVAALTPASGGAERGAKSERQPRAARTFLTEEDAAIATPRPFQEMVVDTEDLAFSPSIVYSHGSPSTRGNAGAVKPLQYRLPQHLQRGTPGAVLRKDAPFDSRSSTHDSTDGGIPFDELQLGARELLIEPPLAGNGSTFFRASEASHNNDTRGGTGSDHHIQHHQAHLRALRKRQHLLLLGHKSLPKRERDQLADQRRIAIHKDRAEATVEEIYLDSAGNITDKPSGAGAEAGPAGEGNLPISRLRYTASESPTASSARNDDGLEYPVPAGSGVWTPVAAATTQQGKLDCARGGEFSRGASGSTLGSSPHGRSRGTELLIEQHTSTLGRTSSFGSATYNADSAAVRGSASLLHLRSLSPVTRQGSHAGSVARMSLSAAMGGTCADSSAAVAAHAATEVKRLQRGGSPPSSQSAFHGISSTSSRTDTSDNAASLPATAAAAPGTRPALPSAPGHDGDGTRSRSFFANAGRSMPPHGGSFSGSSGTPVSDKAHQISSMSEAKRAQRRSQFASKSQKERIHTVGADGDGANFHAIPKGAAGAGPGEGVILATAAATAADSHSRSLVLRDGVPPPLSQSNSRSVLSRMESDLRLDGGLQRAQDFLMVTANVENAAGGGSVMRKVVFRAKGADGSLSITGGRPAMGASKRHTPRQPEDREVGDEAVNRWSSRGSVSHASGRSRRRKSSSEAEGEFSKSGGLLPPGPNATGPGPGGSVRVVASFSTSVCSSEDGEAQEHGLGASPTRSRSVSGDNGNNGREGEPRTRHGKPGAVSPKPRKLTDAPSRATAGAGGSAGGSMAGCSRVGPLPTLREEAEPHGGSEIQGSPAAAGGAGPVSLPTLGFRAGVGLPRGATDSCAIGRPVKYTPGKRDAVSSGSSSEEDDEEDDSDDDEDLDLTNLASLDDMTGNALTSKLDDLLTELQHVSTTDADQEDPELGDLLPFQLTAWEDDKRSAHPLVYSFPRNNAAITPAHIARMHNWSGNKAPQQPPPPAKESTPIGASGKGMHHMVSIPLGSGKRGMHHWESISLDTAREGMSLSRASGIASRSTATSEHASEESRDGGKGASLDSQQGRSPQSRGTGDATSDEEEDEEEAEENCEMLDDGIDAAGKEKAHHAGPSISSPLQPAGPAPEVAATQPPPPPVWDACYFAGRWVCCPTGTNTSLGLVYGAWDAKGKRATMEDRSVMISSLTNSIGAMVERTETAPARSFKLTSTARQGLLTTGREGDAPVGNLSDRSGTGSSADLLLTGRTAGNIRVRPEYAFFAVYDGHNGVHACEMLSQSMHFRLADNLSLLGHAAEYGSQVMSRISSRSGASSSGRSRSGTADHGALQPDSELEDQPAWIPGQVSRIHNLPSSVGELETGTSTARSRALALNATRQAALLTGDLVAEHPDTPLPGQLQLSPSLSQHSLAAALRPPSTSAAAQRQPMHSSLSSDVTAAGSGAAAAVRTPVTLAAAAGSTTDAKRGEARGIKPSSGRRDGALLSECAALVRSCLDVDSELLEAVSSSPGEPIAGSTACMLLVRGLVPPHPPHSLGGAAPAPEVVAPELTLICANVGDSRAVLSRGGMKIELSSDHKPSRPDERARILAAGGRIIKDRVNGVLAVSRAFGDAEHKRKLGSECWGQALTADPVTAEPEVMHEPLQPSDEFVVIASDGLYDVMTSQQVVNFVRRRLLEHRDVGLAARELIRKALALGTIDNVSAIIVAFQRVPRADSD